MVSSMLAVNRTAIYSPSLTTSKLLYIARKCLMKAISTADKKHFFFTGVLNCNGVLNHNYGLERKKKNPTTGLGIETLSKTVTYNEQEDEDVQIKTQHVFFEHPY